MESAKQRIQELEAEVEELRGQMAGPNLGGALNEEGSLPQSQEESEFQPEEGEEVKQQQEINQACVAELAKRLNCDASNQEELKSLELALKLEEEERRQQVVHLEAQQQAFALRMLGNDPRTTAGINPDDMTYEQLLELEEKMGSVSKGLPADKVAVRRNHNPAAIEDQHARVPKVIHC